ncbi:acyl-CoA--sterol O-acyltransferase 1-like [Rhododendron vialii]|uniref:acyl-CoA--sterol O-acyltransferase 1-like n=1 Tax=Rhododendron vialii TaxID=182163 RepID=UPI00265EA53F|nr:acyl-CoA--sterol O-acyltransferase 1-like [Rhododendron vialii]
MEGEIYYPSYTLEREISNFIKVWISVVVSLCYCYFSAKFISKGMPRLLSIIPIVSLFFALPLKLHSVNLCGPTAFAIAWLSNFKLLLLAFGKGPLSHPSLSLPHFIAIACFPIRIQQDPPPKSHANQENSLTSQNRDNPYPLDQDCHHSQNPPPKGHNRENPYPIITHNGNTSIWNDAIKVVFLALSWHVYKYSDHIHPKVMLVSYCFHTYFMLKIVLTIAAAAARALFGLELEPPFDKPYLSTSVQNFWGRRWNLVASRTLRSTVYEPALCVSSQVIGRKWASLPAVMCTFVVSALMHEIIFYYIGRLQPTWEVTRFFLLHGACVVAEIWIKKVVSDRWRLPRLISTPMTLGFVMVTGYWLFFPQLLRCKSYVRASEEYAVVGAFVKDIVAGVVKSIV